MEIFSALWEEMIFRNAWKHEMRTLSSRGRTDNTLFTANSTGVDCLRALGDFENSADGYKKDKLMVVKLHILGQQTF